MSKRIQYKITICAENGEGIVVACSFQQNAETIAAALYADGFEVKIYKEEVPSSFSEKEIARCERLSEEILHYHF